jgi:hypothetical protein
MNACKILNGKFVCMNPQGFVFDCEYGTYSNPHEQAESCAYYHEGTAECANWNAQDLAEPYVTPEEQKAANEKVYQAAKNK